MVRVVGKGAKERLVYLDNGAAEAIADYIASRGAAPGAFLWCARKGGKLNAGVLMIFWTPAWISLPCCDGGPLAGDHHATIRQAR